MAHGPKQRLIQVPALYIAPRDSRSAVAGTRRGGLFPNLPHEDLRAGVVSGICTSAGDVAEWLKAAVC